MEAISSALEEVREKLRQTRQEIEALENWFLEENIKRLLWEEQAKEESLAGEHEDLDVPDA